jgi:hypothetical protein
MEKHTINNLTIKLFLIFLFLISVFALFSTKDLLGSVFTNTVKIAELKAPTTEIIDPQSSPNIIVEKFFNYYYNNKIVNAYNLLSDSRKTTLASSSNLANYLNAPTDVPDTVEIDSINYDNGVTIVKTSSYFKSNVLKNEFGLIVENISWKIDYINPIKVYTTINNITKWKKSAVTGISFKYPSDWDLIRSSQKQLIIKPHSGFNSNTKIQIDIQSGATLKDALDYLSCSKIANSVCYLSSINGKEFHNLDTKYTNAGTNIKTSFLTTENKGSIYVISVFYTEEEADKLSEVIESILSTITI